MTRKHVFTLIELLVVISIIAGHLADFAAVTAKG
jgi:type II secretory pathway pseudopilin PulG